MCSKNICLLITEPIIRFGETKFSVSEPKDVKPVAVVKIPVLRLGDTSKVSVVRVHTKDGSATSGEDYHPISEGRVILCIFYVYSDDYHILLFVFIQDSKIMFVK